MALNVIDYFATIGKREGPLKCQSSSLFKSLPETVQAANLRELWNLAITDIAIIANDVEEEAVDSSWEIISGEVAEDGLRPAKVGIKRRKESNKLSHIINVKIIPSGEALPIGFELLDTSFSGKYSGSFDTQGFLAVSRADISSAMFLEGQHILTDVIIALESKWMEVEEEYLSVGKVGVLHQKQKGKYALAYSRCPAMGICDLIYDSATVDRYPKQDHRGSHLPVEELPMFTFPSGMHLTYQSTNQCPLPMYFTFVFTDANGDHFYTACLLFYESVDINDIKPVFKEIYGDHMELTMLPGTEVYCPKVICIVSRLPFYRAMRRFLRQIYSISLSTLACPIEYFIASVVGQIPVPIEGGRPFHVMLDAALIAPTSTAMAPIIFQLPNKQDFTHMDLDFAAPLRSFSVENFLTVFTLMLREAKMIFICRSNTLLTETMETLKSLLFPLTWSSCFVSRLPDALLGMLEAPGGFMIGLHVPDENYVSTNEVDMHYHHRSKVRSSESAVEYLVRRICSRNSIAEGTYLFDLSYNKLYQYKGNSMSPLSSNTLESLLRMLPGGPRIRLQQKLHSIAERYEIGPQTKGLEEFDSAFDFQSPDEGKVTAQMWRDFPTLVIRDAFMVFMIDLLGNFPKYLIPPIEDLSADTFRTFKEEFYVNEYLLDADPSGTRPLLSLLMETQMFAVLLQQRSEGEQFNVVFFENAASLLRELELSAGGHGSRTNHANNIAEMPAPLYQLLATKIRWAALSKLSRAQIIERFPSFLNGEKEQSIHQLSIIHISSGLSPIKGANLLSFTKTHRSLHPMTNESLKDLITLWRVVSADQISSDGKHEESIHSIYQMRTELDRNEDLMLHDPNFGPLVIPGPILVDPQCKDVEVNEKDWRRLLLDRSIARSGEFGVTLEYSYPRGFPMFDQQLLEDALKYAIHPQLREIRADRAFAIEQVHRSVPMFVRTPTERLAFDYRGKTQLAGKNEMTEDSQAVLSAMVDLASISVLMLATRVLHLSSPYTDVLQMLGLFAQLEEMGLLPSIHESVWRAVLVACANTGGNLMRKIACVIFESATSLLESKSPNALTYGQYIQALCAKQSCTEMAISSASPIDQFIFLEEMGFLWYVQKSALIEHAQVSQQYSEKAGASASPSSMFQNAAVVKQMPPNSPKSPGNSSKWYPFSSHEEGSLYTRGLNAVSGRRLVVRAATEAAKTIAEKLELERSPGILSFRRTDKFPISSNPRPIKSLKSSDEQFLETELNQRLIWMSEEASTEITNFRMSSATEKVAELVRRKSKEENFLRAKSFTKDSKTSTVPVPNGSLMSRLGTKFFGKSSSADPALQDGSNHSLSPSASIDKEMSRNASWGQRLVSSMSQNSLTDTANALSSTLKIGTTYIGSSPSPHSSPKPRLSELRQLSEKNEFDDEVEEASVAESHSVVESETSSEEDSEDVKAVVSTDLNVDLAVDDVELSQSSAIDDERSGTLQIDTEAILTVDPDTTSPNRAKSEPETQRAREVIDVKEIQNAVMRSFHKDYSTLGFCVGIHSYTACRQCRFAMMDEEITSKWCKSEVYDLHQKTKASAKFKTPFFKSRPTPKLETINRIDCPVCESTLNPLLHVRCYKLNNSVLEDESDSEVGNDPSIHKLDTTDLEIVWSEDVNHVSPFALRFELEEVMQRVGQRIVEPKYMRDNHPQLYWGIMWYSTRFATPSGFTCGSEYTNGQNSDKRRSSRRSYLSRGNNKNNDPIAAYMLTAPVVVGWRQCVVKARVQRVLLGKIDSDVTVKELFPYCSEEEIVDLENVITTKLDGSLIGMREAMLRVVACRGIFTSYEKDRDDKSCSSLDNKTSRADSSSTSVSESLPSYGLAAGSTSARVIYVALLQLSQLYDIKNLLPKQKRGIEALNKVYPYDKLYKDTVKCVISKSDEAIFNASDEELLRYVADKSIQTVRIGFGSLL